MGVSTAMIKELRARPDRVFSTFEIDLVGETYRFANRPIASTSGGQYLNRVAGWGAFQRRGFGQSYGLERASGSVNIEDQDGAIGRLLGGPARNEFEGSPVRCYLRSPSVGADDHYLFFTGVLFGLSITGTRQYGLQLSPDILILSSTENNLPRITESTWPNGPKRVITAGGQPGQVVYGQHRSAGNLGSAGMVAAIPVDVVNHYWYVSVGKILADDVVAVYLDGVDATSDFDVVHVFNDGSYFTVLEYTGSDADYDEEESDVTVDLDGVRQSDVLVDNPADMLAHFLTNFVFATPSAEWNDTDDDNLDTECFEKTRDFLSARGYRGSRVLTSDDAGIAVVNGFCQELKMGAFWSSSWKLAVCPIDHSVLDITDAPIVRTDDLLDPTKLSGTPRTHEQVTNLGVSYLLDSSVRSLKQGPVGVTDPLRTGVLRTLNVNWLRASVV